MRKAAVVLFVIVSIISSCENKKEISSISPVNWNKRTIYNSLNDTLKFGKTYLAVYSQIYNSTEHRTHDLTATISIRNTNLKDTIYIQKADYYNTKGNLIRTYFNKTIYILPLETVEIVIDESDKEGGTGANFVFHWMTNPTLNEPLFEAVMISTTGQQGLSFTTQGKKIN